jgi:hypothetical protein
LKTFASNCDHSGVRLSLMEIRGRFLNRVEEKLPVSEWSSSGDPEILRGLSAVGLLLQEVDDDKSTEITLSDKFVADLSDIEAKALGLPPSVPYQLRVWSQGTLLDGSYTINSELIDAGQPVLVDERKGAVIEIGNFSYRVPNPLYDIIEAARGFPEDRDGKISALARINQLATGESVKPATIAAEKEITNIRIRHAAGFSANVRGTLDDPSLSPVFFARHAVEAAMGSGDLLDEAHQILDPSQHDSFEGQFSKDDSARSTYLLSTGEYVFVDPSVRPVLQAFHNICKGDPETRNAFVKSPHAMLSSKIAAELDEPEALVEAGFVETAQFSERVLGINKWVAPDLPWLIQERNEWGIDILVFEQPGSSTPVMMPKDLLNDAIESIEAGLSAGQSTAQVGGQQIPVSEGLLEEMRRLLPAEAERDDQDGEDGDDQDGEDGQEEEAITGPFVVDTKDDFEVINYTRPLDPPKTLMAFETPRVLLPLTTLLPHQEAGIRWLIEAYNRGCPGVLIADDMGLGKTLQALIFLALYQAQVPKPERRPCLIVAPTGLLNNWLKEVTTHLGEGGLGEILKAYSPMLRSLKLAGTTGRDIDYGTPMIDTQALERSDIVLTTYETLRDYQVSFAQVAFGCVIFDEIQKTKNPRSLISRAAAAVNGKYQIGLSGTPVENSLADLWTIMDILAPGLLTLSLKDFLERFGGSPDNEETLERLQELHRQLLEPNQGHSAPVLRRLKEEVFDDNTMPKKFIHPASSTVGEMPAEQANAYRVKREEVQRGEIKVVQGLQYFKRISLSSRPYEQWPQDQEGFISASGRLSKFFEILDKVAVAGEKALVFVESLALQPVLSQVLKERYSLKKLPLIINGAVNGKARQNAVDEFQAGDLGFNVILISPKAGGIGLTLTAANHVLHLERWWNPAVEDQCNDRAYRIGQKLDVNIYTPISKHPVDEIRSFDVALDEILTRKRKLARSLFVPSEISAGDFNDLFGETPDHPTFRPLTIEESYELETGEDFEDYVASSLFASGFTIQKTKRSWDGGCDLIAKKGSKIVLCQCKQVRSNKVLTQGVDDILGSKAAYKRHEPTNLCLITNALQISRPQTDLASENQVIVANGTKINYFGQFLSERI